MRNVIVRHLRNKRASRGQHPGLLLQRYLCEKAAGDDGNPEEKKAILLAAINAATNPEVRQLYDAAYERWKSSLLSTAQTTIVKTLGRLIVGLGSENVTETGITLHHTFGMPVIPGSALKGLAAHYCHQVWGEQDDRFRMATEKEDEAYRKYLAGKRPQPEKDNFHRLLFGNTDDSGCILFHDAWYVPGSDPQPLRRDVMTPHHKDWLDGRKPPTDFDSPTPVSFLSVRGSFLIALSWCGPDTPAARDWTGKTIQLLTDALKYWGVGGKTSSGYGRMLPDDAANQKLEQDRKKLEEERKRRQEQQQFEQELASGSDELRELKSLQREQNWRSDPGDQNMVQSLKEFVNAHQNLPDDCVEFIRTWLESIPNYSSVWDEPDAMKGKNKDKPKYGSQAIREIVRKVNPRFRTKDH